MGLVAKRAGEYYTRGEHRPKRQQARHHIAPNHSSAKECFERYKHRSRQDDEQPGVMQTQPDGWYPYYVQVGQEDQYQRAEENGRINQPGAAKQQRHLHNRFGLEKHESRSKEEHPVVQPPPTFRLEKVHHADPENAEQDHRSDG